MTTVITLNLFADRPEFSLQENGQGTKSSRRTLLLGVGGGTVPVVEVSEIDAVHSAGAHWVLLPRPTNYFTVS